MFEADNYSLRKLNAFRFEHSAALYAECRNHSELRQFIHTLKKGKSTHDSPLVFGEGSNTILTRDIKRPVIRFTGEKISLKPNADDSSVQVNVQAGKNWHQFVIDMTARGLQGIENLSLIPGTCGAAPVQNIVAYGVELSDTLINVSAWHWPTQKMQLLSREDCQFGYRNSLFKRKPDEYIITSVTLKLDNETKPDTSYRVLEETLVHRNIINPTPQDVSDVVCEIRQSKLPDPDILPNAGSFFKNPIITNKDFERLIKLYPEMPSYPAETGHVKVAAGWLIETAGLKGYQHESGHVAIHDKQALVLVHHGGGNAGELMQLSGHIQDTVSTMYGVTLEREPVLR